MDEVHNSYLIWTLLLVAGSIIVIIFAGIWVSRYLIYLKGEKKKDNDLNSSQP